MEGGADKQQKEWVRAPFPLFSKSTLVLCAVGRESAGHTVNTLFWVSLSRRYVPGRKWRSEAVGICDPATWREDNEGKCRHQRGEKHQHQSWSLRGQARPAPSIPVTQAGWTGVWGHPWLHIKFKASLGNMGSCLTKQKKRLVWYFRACLQS